MCVYIYIIFFYRHHKYVGGGLEEAKIATMAAALINGIYILVSCVCVCVGMWVCGCGFVSLARSLARARSLSVGVFMYVCTYVCV